MRIHRAFTLGLAALAVAASDAARPVAGSSAAGTCVRCHGGAQDDSGAPPLDAHGRSDPSLPSVGAHAAHVASGLDCGACHVKPGPSGDGHVDGRVAIVWGPLATADGALSPAYDGAGGSPTYACSSVYCHGHFTGGTPGTPVWTAAGQGQVVCGTCHALPPAAPHPEVAGGLAACSGCHPETVGPGGQLVPGGAHVDGQVSIGSGHPADWMEPAGGGFHAFSANAGLAGCQSCHGADLEGGSVGVGCGECHDADLPAGVPSWRVNCVMCHGGTDNGTGAPPRATWGNAGDATRVGAHSAHLAPSDASPGFDCGVCHVKPSDALSAGHVGGGTATVAFAGLAVNGVTPAPTWNRASATCDGTYCHGAQAGATPVWTRVGQGEAACGTCHGLPPAGNHPVVTGGLPACAGCHSTTVDAIGALVPPSAGGTHLNGLVDGGGHSAAWMDPTSPEFHAFSADRNLAGCKACHGADLGGGAIGVGCGACHDAGLPPGVTTWAESCVMCHGGVDNATGAPPAARWGYAGDPARGGGTADPVRVGAHTAHLTPTAVSPGFDCGVCHVKPADALAPGHVEGEIADVAFSGLAVNGVTPAPAWGRAAATCSGTYCHGGPGGATPVWTQVGQGEAACGTCHGLPPTVSHPPVSGGLPACSACHATTVDATGELIPPSEGGLHLNGAMDAQGHEEPWMDTASAGFHAFSANVDAQACTACHSTAPGSSAIARSCDRCHALPVGAASWPVNCVMCHGGGDDATGAPPRATWGNAGDPLRVGAHSAHLATAKTAPIDCGACHPTPADAFSPGHLGDGTADIVWGGRAVAGGAQPAWNRAAGSCATTYCHGNYSGIYTYSYWDYGTEELVYVDVPYAGANATPLWTGAGTTCGSCHGDPPPGGWHSASHGYVPSQRQCQLCHPDASGDNATGGAAITDPARHLNGALDVAPRWGSGCGCHD